MEINTEKYNDTNYKVCNGTFYHCQTDDEMVLLLEKIRLNKTRVRFHWGDTQTGKDWGDIFDVKGRLGRSMGIIKVPILLYSNRSMGGSAILDHCIVKIQETTNLHRVLYQHPNYHV